LDGSPLWWPCSRAYATVSHAHRRAPRAPRSGLEHPVGGCRLRTAPSRLSPGSAHWRCTRPWATARALVQVAGLSLQYVTKLCILRDECDESSVHSDTESPISEPLGFLRSARSMAHLSLQWCVCVFPFRSFESFSVNSFSVHSFSVNSFSVNSFSVNSFLVFVLQREADEPCLARRRESCWDYDETRYHPVP
jgi:hypothetical protein